MLIPYMEFDDNTIVTHNKPNKLGKVTVHIETPDNIFCFKTCDILLPDITIEDRYGFTDEEMANWVRFCKNNSERIIYYANRGGIANA